MLSIRRAEYNWRYVAELVAWDKLSKQTYKGLLHSLDIKGTQDIQQGFGKHIKHNKTVCTVCDTAALQYYKPQHSTT